MCKVLFASIAAIVLVLLFTSCGHHHGIVVTPNPSGGNNVGFLCAGGSCNATLNGTYVFTIHGTNFRKLANFDVTGNFIADGNGNITGGVQDSVDDVGDRTLNESITGTYFVNQDGRGQAILNTNTDVNSSSGQVILRFVLESHASGKLFQIGTTSNGVRIDAVGIIELQTDAPTPPSGAYIVRLDREFSPFGAVGRIVVTSGQISGLLDQKDGRSFLANQNTSGSIANFSSGRATATLTVKGLRHNFAVYFVSTSQLELISTDKNFLLQGPAEFQSSFSSSTSDFAAAAPDQVFALAGFDGFPFGPRAELGRMTINPNGLLVNAVEDIQSSSNLNPFTLVVLNGSSLVVGINGRWTMRLINANAPTPNLVGWQISPRKSVVLTTNNDIVETGNLRGQTLGLTTALVTGNFAESLSGFDFVFGANLELIANLLLDGFGGMSGTLDSQDDTSTLNLNVATTGTYSIDQASGRSTGKIDAASGSIIPANGLPVVYYAVDSQFLYFLPTRPRSIYLGTLIGQMP